MDEDGGDRADARSHGPAKLDGETGEARPLCGPSQPQEKAPDPWALLIVRIAQERDAAAFKALFEAFAPRLKGFLLHQGLAPAAAEELAQEALLTVWRKANYFDPHRASAAAWIFTLARNLRIDAYRRGRAVLPPDIDPLSDQDAPAAAEGMVLAAERDGRLHDAMRGLPANQVEVLQSSFFHDKPHAQIARELDLPLGTVKSRIRTALLRLRELLGDTR
jgi:RNA polymerase sigma-70 factor (ECF subfamily)